MTDLSAPLSRHGARKARDRGGRRLPHLPVTRIALGLVGILALAIGARLLLVDDPTGGRPSATTQIAAGTGNAVAGSVSNGTATITADPDMIPLEDVPQPGTAASSIAVLDPAAIDPELVEETEFGPIPRISGTGLTPFDMYSRPAITSGRPRIAIVVSGLGLNTESTQQAIESLPQDISMAFAPYGRTLDKTVSAARAEGHEIFLEVPLEPFDYPDNDPGPDTLLTGQPPRENMSRLFKVMSKFGGYAGIVNNMGARFTASGADFGPMMEELGARGLGYLDDGSSNRSLAPQLARANRVPFARVTAPLDLNPSRSGIQQELAALEQRAKAGGSAIGIISALPVSIEAVSEWAAALSDRGFDLVPATALMGEE